MVPGNPTEVPKMVRTSVGRGLSWLVQKEVPVVWTELGRRVPKQDSSIVRLHCTCLVLGDTPDPPILILNPKGRECVYRLWTGFVCPGVRCYSSTHTRPDLEVGDKELERGRGERKVLQVEEEILGRTLNSSRLARGGCVERGECVTPRGRRPRRRAVRLYPRTHKHHPRWMSGRTPSHYILQTPGRVGSLFGNGGLGEKVRGPKRTSAAKG